MPRYDELAISLFDNIDFGAQFDKSRKLEDLATPGHTLNDVQAYVEATTLKAETGQVIAFTKGLEQRDGIVTLSSGEKVVVTNEGEAVPGFGMARTTANIDTWRNEAMPFQTTTVTLKDGTMLEVIDGDPAQLFGGQLIPGRPMVDLWHMNGTAPEAILTLAPEDQFITTTVDGASKTESTHSIKLNRPLNPDGSDNYAFSADPDTLKQMRYIVGIAHVES